MAKPGYEKQTPWVPQCQLEFPRLFKPKLIMGPILPRWQIDRTVIWCFSRGLFYFIFIFTLLEFKGWDFTSEYIYIYIIKVSTLVLTLDPCSKIMGAAPLAYLASYGDWEDSVGSSDSGLAMPCSPLQSSSSTLTSLRRPSPTPDWQTTCPIISIEFRYSTSFESPSSAPSGDEEIAADEEKGV